MNEFLAVWVVFKGGLGSETGKGGAKNYGVGLILLFEANKQSLAFIVECQGLIKQ